MTIIIIFNFNRNTILINNILLNKLSNLFKINSFKLIIIKYKLNIKDLTYKYIFSFIKIMFFLIAYFIFTNIADSFVKYF